MSRRQALWLAAGGAGLLTVPARATTLATPLANAYDFLDTMMDLYASGGALRVVQSFVPNKVLRLGDAAYTYDNALVLLAYLLRGQPGDLNRAQLLGQSLAYAQTHDPIGDGRVRDGYHADPFLKANGDPNIDIGDGDQGSDCGNMAWTGLALCQLYQSMVAAGEDGSAILNAALGIANWIQSNAYSTTGAGGYTSGFDSHLKPQTYKSTELNIDIYALFTMLATLDSNATWSPRAAHAQTFVEALWYPKIGFFWVGTGDNGVTLNKTLRPEDVQSWSYLALGNPAYQTSLDWVNTTLYRVDGNYTGVCFSTVDSAGVWFEGTAHMAAALRQRNAVGDAARAQQYLQSIELAQADAIPGQDLGVVAASRTIKTGDGDRYFKALHIGATSWYCMAKQAGNPLKLYS